MIKSANKWVLLCYMKDGSKAYIGPFNTRAQAQFYATRVEGLASHETEWLIKPFN